MATDLLLDRYELLETVGRGGSSEIIKAFDRRMERIVAIKTIPANKKTAVRALREARTVALLNHPNIVTLYEFEVTDDYYYLIMEYIDGVTLERFLSGGEPLDQELAAAIVIQVCQALENAHLNDVIHRDIKPANLMLIPDGRVKVMDFGVSRLKGTPVTREGQIAGTFSYMSPEQAKGELVDERSDVWSLGVVLYEMLTGINPFDAETPAAAVMKIVGSDPEPPRALNEKISAGLSKVVVKTINKYPEDRFDLATDLRYKLERYRRSNRTPKSIVKEAVSALAPPPRLDPNIRPISYLRTYIAETTERYGQAVIRFFLFGALGTLTFLILSGTGSIPMTVTAVIALIIFLSGAVFPQPGLIAFMTITVFVLAGKSIPMATAAAFLFFVYWYFFGRTNSQPAAIPFVSPLLALTGIPFAYPLGLAYVGRTNIAPMLAALGFLLNLLVGLIFQLDVTIPTIDDGEGFVTLLFNPFTVWQLAAWTATAFFGSLISQKVKLFRGYLSLILTTAFLSASYNLAPEYLDLGDTASVSVVQPMTFSFIILLVLLAVFDYPKEPGRPDSRPDNLETENNRSKRRKGVR